MTWKVYCPSPKPTRRGWKGMARKWRDITRRDPCPFCLASPCETMDHIMPLGQIREANMIPFGASSWQNLTGACMRCNEDKGDMGLLSFLLVRSYEKRVKS